MNARRAVATAHALVSTCAMAALRAELTAAALAARGVDPAGPLPVALPSDWVEDDGGEEKPEAPATPYVAGQFHRVLGSELDDFAHALRLLRQARREGRAPQIVGPDGRVRRIAEPRLILGAPPRHGKTLHVTSMAARLMACEPGLRVLYATSTDDRARDASLAVRALVEALYREDPRGMAHLAPGERWTDTDWMTAGGCRWTSIGAGVATGGIGADLVVVDDVTGSRDRARSAAWRTRIQSWLEEDVLSRGEAPCAVLVMETRRHEDDVEGYLLRTQPGRWQHLVYRTVAERGDDVYTPWRREGDYLWPERYGPAWRAGHPELHDGSRVWASLHQQRPAPETGGIWPREYLSHRYQGTPEAMAALCDLRVLVLDGAATAGRGDHTVIQHWGWVGARAHLLGQWRGQWGYPVARQTLLDLVGQHRPQAVVIEDASSGRQLAQELGAVVPGLVAIPARGSKRARWEAVQPQHAAGQVLLPEVTVAPWVAGLIDRHLVLTGEGDEVDDEADAHALALAWRVTGVLPTVRRTGLRRV